MTFWINSPHLILAVGGTNKLHHPNRNFPGDGEVLAVLDLRTDPGLIEAGMARELVNRCGHKPFTLWSHEGATPLRRPYFAHAAAGSFANAGMHTHTQSPRFQRLRKKAGLTVTDAVELYYEQLPASSSTASFAAGDAAGDAPGDAAGGVTPVTVAALVERQGAYLKESLGCVPVTLGDKPAGSVVIAREEASVGGEQGMVFAVVLAAPAGSAAATSAAAGKVAALAV